MNFRSVNIVWADVGNFFATILHIFKNFNYLNLTVFQLCAQ